MAETIKVDIPHKLGRAAANASTRALPGCARTCSAAW